MPDAASAYVSLMHPALSATVLHIPANNNSSHGR